ncbi:MAG: hypothetical protein QM489_04930 [Candidatus Izemoplasma sp.]
MKKITSIILATILMFTLSGCSLAKDNSYYDEAEIKLIKTPYAVVFKLYNDNSTYIEEVTGFDVDEYLYFSYVCEGEEYNEERICINIGKSITGDLDIGVHDYILNDEFDKSMITYYFEGYIYVSNEIKGTIICISARYTNDIEGKLNGGFCTNFYGGATLSINSFGLSTSGQEVSFEFKGEIILVDELNTIVISEYNDTDELLNTTIINSTFESYGFTASSEATYLIISENYTDEEGLTYSDRTLIEKDLISQFFNMMFTDEIGFIVVSPLVITFDE